MKLFIVLLICFIFIFGGACKYKPGNEVPKEYLNWDVVKSPKTGKCFEIIWWNIGSGSQTMASTEEIDCRYYD